MKRIVFVFICLIVPVSLSAEKNPYYVYGVDFSKVNDTGTIKHINTKTILFISSLFIS